MALEKEARTNIMGSDIDRRNRNWDKVSAHLAENATKAHGGFKGVLLRKNTAQSIPANAVEAVKWEEAIYDTSNFFKLSSPTRITIPSGVSKVRLVANSAWAINVSGGRYIAVYKNNEEIIGLPMIRFLPDTRANQNVSSAVIQVVVGDYFELKVHQTTGGALDFVSNFQTWFSLEVVE